MSLRDLAFSVAIGCGGLLGACSGSTVASPNPASAQPDASPADASPVDAAPVDNLEGGSCNIVPKTVTGLTAVHVAECSPIDYPDEPPAGGNHYPVWAAFQTFSFPVPRGFWVHDLEHGAIVFSYNCADGCADEVASVQALIDALPTDPLCAGGPPRRVVLTPDPLLTARWGVSAWGHTLRADCVDADRFTRFYLDHFGQGPEILCAQGTDFDGLQPCLADQ